MDNEASQNDATDCRFLVPVLSVFRCSLTNVASLVGDSGSTNRPSFCKIVRILIDCNDHHLNIAVNDIILKHATVTDSGNYIVGKLSQAILAGWF